MEVFNLVEHISKLASVLGLLLSFLPLGLKLAQSWRERSRDRIVSVEVGGLKLKLTIKGGAVQDEAAALEIVKALGDATEKTPAK